MNEQQEIERINIEIETTFVGIILPITARLYFLEFSFVTFSLEGERL
jgi:hypothetical protein